MNVALMKKIPMVLASLAFSSTVFAGGNKKDGCCSVELANGKYGCYLQDNRGDVDLEHNLQLGVSAVYWQSYTQGTDYAFTTSQAAAALPITGSIVAPKEKMSWGFKVDLGYLFEKDGWQSDFIFTFYRGKGNHSYSQTGGNTSFIVPTKAVTGGILDGTDVTSFANASADLSSKFYRLDFVTSRGTFLSQNLSLRPGLALTTYWLDITQNNQFRDGDNNVLSDNARSNTWQIGPTAVLDTQLHFGRSGFSIIGCADTGLGFGNTKISELSSYSVDPADNSANINFNRSTFSPHSHVLLGVQYDTSFYECTQHLMLRAALDTYVIWNGNRTIEAVNTTPRAFSVVDQNNYSLVGLTLSMGYQF